MGTLGEKIRELRGTDIGLRQLARDTDISPSHLSQIEQGVRRPSLGMVERLAKSLGVQPSVLLNTLDDDDDSARSA